MSPATSLQRASGSEQSACVVSQSCVSAVASCTAPPVWAAQNPATGPLIWAASVPTVVASAVVPAGATSATVTVSVAGVPLPDGVPVVAGAVEGAGAAARTLAPSSCRAGAAIRSWVEAASVTCPPTVTDTVVPVATRSRSVPRTCTGLPWLGQHPGQRTGEVFGRRRAVDPPVLDVGADDRADQGL